MKRIERHHNDKIQVEYWRDGKRHREDGPWYTCTTTSGQVLEIHWAQNDLMHNENGPAVEEYSRSGELIKRAWLVNGVLHRLDGPAFERRRGFSDCDYYINGEPIQARDYWSRPDTHKKIGDVHVRGVLAVLPQPIAEEIYLEFRPQI